MVGSHCGADAVFLDSLTGMVGHSTLMAIALKIGSF